MPIEWPSVDDGPFQWVFEDLLPLDLVYGTPRDEGAEIPPAYDGRLVLPDGLDELSRAPLSSGSIHAVPWEFHGIATVSRRGVEGQKDVIISGVTVVTDGEPREFRRYVDWANVWAQLGVSSGRGEETEQFTLGPDGQPLDPEQQC